MPPWTRERRIKAGLDPDAPSRKQLREAKYRKRGKFEAPTFRKKTPSATPVVVPASTTPAVLPPAGPIFSSSPDVFHFEAPSLIQQDTIGEEINTNEPTQKAESKEAKPNEATTAGTVELDELFDDDEIQEILEILWRGGGNKLLKKMGRECMEEQECQKLGRITFLVLKKHMGEKVKVLPEFALVIYAALVFTTKDKKTTAGELPASTTPAVQSPAGTEYLPPAGKALPSPEEWEKLNERQGKT